MLIDWRRAPSVVFVVGAKLEAICGHAFFCVANITVPCLDLSGVHCFFACEYSDLGCGWGVGRELWCTTQLCLPSI